MLLRTINARFVPKADVGNHGLRRRYFTSSVRSFLSQSKRLPVVAHADLAADAIDVVAKGEIELGQCRSVSARVEKVHSPLRPLVGVLQVVFKMESAAIGDQIHLIIATEMAPNAADEERLHDAAPLPCGKSPRGILLKKDRTRTLTTPRGVRLPDEALRNFDELLPIQVIAIRGNNKTEDGE